jgi:hypothetical protein
MVVVPNKPSLVGVCGKKGAGKNSCVPNLDGKEEYSFARKLKDASKLWFTLTEAQVDGHLKDTVDARYGYTPREFLQWLGTDIMRNEFSAIFCKYWNNGIAIDEKLDELYNDGFEGYISDPLIEKAIGLLVDDFKPNPKLCLRVPVELIGSFRFMMRGWLYKDIYEREYPKFLRASRRKRSTRRSRVPLPPAAAPASKKRKRSDSKKVDNVPVKEYKSYWVDCFRQQLVKRIDRAEMLHNEAAYVHFPTIFVTDVRFPEEEALIREFGGMLIQISRPGLTTTDTHESENLDKLHPNCIIVNDGTIEVLQRTVALCVLDRQLRRIVLQYKLFDLMDIYTMFDQYQRKQLSKYKGDLDSLRLSMDMATLKASVDNAIKERTQSETIESNEPIVIPATVQSEPKVPVSTETPVSTVVLAPTTVSIETPVSTDAAIVPMTTVELIDLLKDQGDTSLICTDCLKAGMREVCVHQTDLKTVPDVLVVESPQVIGAIAPF